MPRKPAEITETELKIMDVLWNHGSATVRDIVERLYSSHKPSLHATVKSLLERLEQKGYVTHDPSRFAHTFAAKIDRETLVGQQLQQIADAHFNGALAPMLLTLIDRVKLSRKQHEALRKLVESMK